MLRKQLKYIWVLAAYTLWGRVLEICYLNLIKSLADTNILSHFLLLQDSGASQPGSLPNTHGNSQDSYQTMGTQKLVEATAEIFKMMNKDYHQKAHRRPPINNNLPLADRRKPPINNNIPTKD